jgi:hypothetical protein
LDLLSYQRRLFEQYTRLRECRATENYPVYAIEHGLSADDRSKARILLNAQLNSTFSADRAYWLVWIAAAAEIGYHYDGTEYWESFSNAFPSWPRYGDRNLIRNWYRRFAIEFRGLTPSGPWARHFPIIAWPITQAILPRYLQRHFADHLYELRHALARSGELTLDEIGDLLSDRYFGGSSRFEGFLQQKALTSRIVMALGIEDVADAAPPIEPAMLGRIVRDFDKLGSSGSRLREARRVLRDASFVNSSKVGFAPSISRQSVNEASKTARFERPRLIARQIDTHSWHFSISIPDLATPLRQIGLSPHEFERARMRFRVFGKGNVWIPGRALFSYTGQSSEALSTYPSIDLHLFEFDRPLPQAKDAINERLFFPAQPLRLLKIRSDGSAFEIAARHVRAGHSYLLISAHSFAESIVDSLSLSPLQSKVGEAFVWKLEVQRSVEMAQVAALKSLGLGYALGVQMEPLGLVPRWNSVSGAIDFLDTEEACFSLVSDLAVKEFSIAVDGNTPVRFKPDSTGTTIISLGALTVGRHCVIASALGAATGTNIESDELLVEVRQSQPWQQAIAGKAGVTLSLDPRQASLEQFFSGDALIRAGAPSGRNFKLDCRFYGADGMLFHDEMIGRFTSPFSDQKLSSSIISKLTSETQSERIDRAVRIELAISLDEFGAETITFEKDAEPLRWVRIDSKTIRLSDDTGGGTLPTIECFDLHAANTARAIEYETAVGGITLKDKGGLLVAIHRKQRFGAVATVINPNISSFSDLGVPASVSVKDAQPIRLLNALKRWHAASRLIGPMAFMARLNAIQALEQRLAQLLCGEDWVFAANSVRDGVQEIDELYGRVFYSRGFGSRLRSYDWQYETDEAGATAEFVRLCSIYKISDDATLCALALKIAFSPWAVLRSDLPSSNAFEMLHFHRALIRGAYFARLAAEVRLQKAALEAS